ncbi:MAG TPA: OB-fold nucleic acid binding domain-containing protein, partial [Anditalea sp.]|nr:OB-fold nucleic acid binding domain-containing protein [Anditalea sp.]
MLGFFDTKIDFLKGVGPQKAALINKELNIFTYGELLQHYPFRYEDRTKFYKINQLDSELDHVQVMGRLVKLESIGEGRRKRLVGYFRDETGEMELTWFKGIQWVVKKLVVGAAYIAFGKPSLYGRKYSIPHPEMEPLTTAKEERNLFQPVYPTTEKLKNRYLDSKGISKVMEGLLAAALPQIQETLPADILLQFNLISKQQAIKEIHFPSDPELLKKARFRLKFEEFFFVQLRLLKLKLTRTEKSRGQVLADTSLLTHF